MSHEICIKRNVPLTLNEWKAAARTVPRVRLTVGDATAVNPVTGEAIRLPGRDGDAEVEIEGKWLPCFRWRMGGSVVFRAPVEFEDRACPVRVVARMLAARLNARMVGEAGEVYE